MSTNPFSALQAWLPMPLYWFVGGPLDGKRREVTLIRTDDGYIAPLLWEHIEFPPLGPPARAGDGRADIALKRHLYKFEPTRSPNEGRYVHIKEGRQ